MEQKSRDKMKWYNRVANFYDFFTVWLYRKARITLIESLEIKEGDSVLVIACGTGQSFELIEEKIGDYGEIIAFDYSEGMLKLAQKRIRKNNWKNIRLIKMDVRDLSRKYLLDNNIKPDFDIVIGELAFTVIPEWKEVMETAVSLLKKEGKFGFLDWYREKKDWLTGLVDYMAKAEINRNIIGHAQEIFEEFTVVKKFFFKNVYVGIGKKR